MNLIEVAQIYTDLVKLEREIPDREYQATEVSGLNGYRLSSLFPWEIKGIRGEVVSVGF